MDDDQRAARRRAGDRLPHDTGHDADVAGWIESIAESGRQLGRVVAVVAALVAPIVIVAVLLSRRRWCRLASLVAAFGCAVQAFGGGVGLPAVGAVYLGAAALGAMEAALVAGLTGAGVEPSLALATVLAYRLATFWLPILPGWLAFHQLERAGRI